MYSALQKNQNLLIFQYKNKCIKNIPSMVCMFHIYNKMNLQIVPIFVTMWATFGSLHWEFRMKN